MRVTSSRAYSRPPPVPRMPQGLVELMEGLTKDVLKNNPTNVFKFCANHMQKLIEIRDGPRKKSNVTLEEKIRYAQEKINKRALARRQQYDKQSLAIDAQNKSIETLSKSAETKPKTPTEILNLNKDFEMEISHYTEDENKENLVRGEIDLSQSENVPMEKSNVNTSEDKIEDAKIAKAIILTQESENQGENEQIETLVPNENHKEPGSNENAFKSNKNSEEREVIELSSPQESDGQKDLAKDNNSTSIMTASAFSLIVSNTEKHNENSDETSTFAEEKLTPMITENESDPIIEADTQIKNTDQNLTSIEEMAVESIFENQGTSIVTGSEENMEKTDKYSNTVKDKEVTTVINKDVVDSMVREAEKQIENSEKSLISYKNNIPEHTEIDNSIKLEVEEASYQELPFSTLENTNSCNSKDSAELLKKNTEQMNQKINVQVTSVEDNKMDSKNEIHMDEITETFELRNVTDDNPFSVDLKLNEDITPRIGGKSPATDNGKNNVGDGTIEFEGVLNEKNKFDALDNKQEVVIINTELKENSNDISESKNIERKNASSISMDVPMISPTSDTTTIERSNSLSETTNENTDIDLNKSDNNNSLDHPKDVNLEAAAITIQKVFRSFLFKSRASTFDEATNDGHDIIEEESEKEDENEYSTLSNLNKERRTLGLCRMDTVTVLQTVNEEKSLSLSTDDSSTLSSAATTIQAHVRGFLVRNRLNSNKTNSNNSLVNSDGLSTASLEMDTDNQKNKTILNIHIVPEGGHFMSRDESMLTSMDLSLDGSPPSSSNLHPLGYDRTQRRKQLKREDAIQSISPPSNNSGKLSEDVECVKEMVFEDVDTGHVGATDGVVTELDVRASASCETTPTESTTVETVLEIEQQNLEFMLTHDRDLEKDANAIKLTKLNNDEMDVVTPYQLHSETISENLKSAGLLHSGECHDMVLPTKVSRADKAVVSGE